MNWGDLNWVDWVVLAILATSVVVSLMRGFVREVLSVTLWIAATIVAYLLGDELGMLFVGWIDKPSLRVTAGMIVIFCMTMVVGGLLNHLLTEAVRKNGLTATDRFFGIFFGLLRGVVIVMVLIMFLPASLQQSKSWQASELVSRFSVMEAGWREAVQGAGQLINRWITQ